MTIYGIPNCNTVQKAIAWLKAKDAAFTFHDFKKQGITADRLEKWFDKFGWENVLNKKGLTFKKLTEAERAAINSAEAAKAYLLQNTSAIKRPVIEQEGKPIAIGFSETAYSHLV